MIPTGIRQEHVLAALALLDGEPVPPHRQSRDFDLVHAGKRYPPKLVISKAGLVAHGAEVPASMFGGGAETNAALAALGFRVERKAGAPRVEPRAVTRTRSGRVRVARAWLRLRGGRAAFRGPGDHAWVLHRREVIEEFHQRPAHYLARRLAVIDTAIEHGADLLIMPACALVGELDARVSARLENVPLFVSGTLGETGAAASEGGVLVERGQVRARYDAGRVARVATSMGEVWAAISSTIRTARDEAPPALDGQVGVGSPIVIDSGHHPYGGRYFFQTLRTVNAEVSRVCGQPAVTILSSWRYPGMTMTCPWVWPSESMANGPTVDLGEGDALDVMDLPAQEA